MPANASPTTSARLLSLLSLLQARRDWPGRLLADRLAVTPRTVRRDIDRLRALGYRVVAVRGPDGGYRLDAGAHLPPLLFDDEQAVALVVALRGAPALGAGVDEAAARALVTLGAVVPTRLRARLDALQPTVVTPAGRAGEPVVAPGDLLTIAAAIRDRDELRFDYRTAGRGLVEPGGAPAREAQPHHLIARGGRWYLVAFVRDRNDWRVYRVDRMSLRTPNGPRFTPRTVPTGDPAAFLAARFTGSDTGDRWPCHGTAVVPLPASEVVPFAGDGTVEALADRRSRIEVGAWSWPGLAALLARFDTDLEQVEPAALRRAFTQLAARATRAAADPTE